MALVGEGKAEGEVCIMRSPGIKASPISLLSMGGVCGRSLTAGKIIFTGRQTYAPSIKYYDSVGDIHKFLLTDR